MKNKLQNKIEEDALLREVVEDVKQEEIQKIWDKYGLYIILGIALVLTIAISFESLKTWRTKKSQELSNAYSVALSLQSQGRLDESFDIYDTLIKKSSGIYADVAKMQVANIYMEQNKQEDAFNVLQAMIDSSDTLPQIKNIAILKLVSYKLNTKASEQEIIDLIQPAVNDVNTKYIANEFLGMLALRENKLDEAKAIYEKIANSEGASENLKARALDILNLLNKPE